MTVETETFTAPVDTGPVNDMALDTSDSAMEAAYDKAMAVQDRDETGRFKAAIAADPASLEGEDGAGAVAASSTVAAATPAPAHLPQAIKADWENIPPTTRDAIVAHQQQMDRKFGELGKQFESVKPIADRFANAVTQFPEFAGMTPDKIAQGALELAAVQSRLHKEPLETILQIAQHYGGLAPLQQKLSGQQVQDNSGQQVAALQRELAELKQTVSPDFIRQQVNAISEEAAVTTQVQDFAASKEFWSEVQPHMATFFEIALNANPGASEMDAVALAYDMAVNAIPSVREKVRLAEAGRPATADVLSVKRAEAAKRATSINVKPASTGKDKLLSEEDAMASAYDRAMAS